MGKFCRSKFYYDNDDIRQAYGANFLIYTVYYRQLKSDATHANGSSWIPDVAQPELALDYQPVRPERVPGAAAAAVQQPARPDDERPACRAVPWPGPEGAAAECLRL